MEENKRFIPKVGDQLYVSVASNGSKIPFTVIEICCSSIIKVQEARIIPPVFHYNPEIDDEYYKQFDGKRVRFYNTPAESIVADSFGRIEELTWKGKRKCWGYRKDSWSTAVFGQYEYEPSYD